MIPTQELRPELESKEEAITFKTFSQVARKIEEVARAQHMKRSPYIHMVMAQAVGFQLGTRTPENPGKLSQLIKRTHSAIVGLIAAESQCQPVPDPLGPAITEVTEVLREWATNHEEARIA